MIIRASYLKTRPDLGLELADLSKVFKLRSDLVGVKNLALVPLIMAFFVATPALGQALHAPKVCEKGPLILENLTSEPQNLWFQYYGEKGFEEVHWLLEKFEVKTLTPEDLPAYDYSIKALSPKVKATSNCGSELVPWTPQVSPSRSWRLRRGFAYKGYIQNLNPKPQSVMIRFLTSKNKLLATQTIQLASHLKTTDFKFWAQGAKLEVVAEGRISVIVQENEAGKMTLLKELAAAPVQVTVDPAAVYFLLSNDQRSDSFIVKLEDPVLIAKARNNISRGLYQLMVATISYASQSENRSLVSPDSTPFSWRVDHVSNFNDFADISCDASPQNVQEKIFDWLANKRICFWSYHLTKELSPREVQFGQLSSQP